MDAGHFRRLIRRGVFPSPKRTQKGLPYFDHETLLVIAEVVKRRVGVNGEEVMWYRRKTKPTGSRTTQPRRRGQDHRQQQPDGDTYVASIVEGCRQVGVPAENLSPEKVASALVEAFGNDRPAPERAIPVVARRLLAGE